MSNPPTQTTKLVNPPAAPNKMEKPGDQKKSRKVRILQDVRVDLEGQSKHLRAGHTYELPSELAEQLTKPVEGMYTFRGESDRIEEKGLIQRAALVD